MRGGCYLKSGESTPPRGVCITYCARTDTERHPGYISPAGKVIVVVFYTNAN